MEQQKKSLRAHDLLMRPFVDNQSNNERKKKELSLFFCDFEKHLVFSSQRKSHYNYRDDFSLEKFEKVKILVYHICPKNR
jgi:hypothetical protein